MRFTVKSRKSFWTGQTTKYVSVSGLQDGQELSESQAMILALHDISDTLAAIAETVEDIRKAQR